MKRGRGRKEAESERTRRESRERQKKGVGAALRELNMSARTRELAAGVGLTGYLTVVVLGCGYLLVRFRSR